MLSPEELEDYRKMMADPEGMMVDPEAMLSAEDLEDYREMMVDPVEIVDPEETLSAEDLEDYRAMMMVDPEEMIPQLSQDHRRRSGVCTRRHKMDCKQSCPPGWKHVKTTDHGCCASFTSCGGTRKICQVKFPCGVRPEKRPSQDDQRMARGDEALRFLPISKRRRQSLKDLEQT